MSALIKMILLKVIKDFVISKVVDELLEYLREKAADTQNTQIDDAIVAGIEASKDDITNFLKGKL